MGSDLLSELGYDSDAPEVLEAVADATALANLVTALVAVRRHLGLRQSDLAHRLGTSQSVVSDFERLGGDPRLSTVQRYARALGTRLMLDLDGYPCADGSWTEMRQETVTSAWTPPSDRPPLKVVIGDVALAA